MDRDGGLQVLNVGGKNALAIFMADDPEELRLFCLLNCFAVADLEEKQVRMGKTEKRSEF
jgi:hypothetical protein